MECWPDVWEFNAPTYGAVLRGEARSFQGQLLKMERDGGSENAWFDLAYSHLRDEAFKIIGILVTVVEAPRQMLAERRIATQVERQRMLFDQAPGFISISTGPPQVYEFGNKAYARLGAGTTSSANPCATRCPKSRAKGFTRNWTRSMRRASASSPSTSRSACGALSVGFWRSAVWISSMRP